MARVHVPCTRMYDDVGLVHFAFRKGSLAVVLGVPSALCGDDAVGRFIPSFVAGLFSVVGYSFGSMADFLSHPASDGAFADIIWHSAQVMMVCIC